MSKTRTFCLVSKPTCKRMPFFGRECPWNAPRMPPECPVLDTRMPSAKEASWSLCSQVFLSSRRRLHPQCTHHPKTIPTSDEPVHVFRGRNRPPKASNTDFEVVGGNSSQTVRSFARACPIYLKNVPVQNGRIIGPSTGGDINQKKRL